MCECVSVCVCVCVRMHVKDRVCRVNVKKGKGKKTVQNELQSMHEENG